MFRLLTGVGHDLPCSETYMASRKPLGTGKSAGTEQLGDQIGRRRRSMREAAICVLEWAVLGSRKEARFWNDWFDNAQCKLRDVSRVEGYDEGGRYDVISETSSNGRELNEVILCVECEKQKCPYFWSYYLVLLKKVIFKDCGEPRYYRREP